MKNAILPFFFCQLNTRNFIRTFKEMRVENVVTLLLFLLSQTSFAKKKQKKKMRV